MHPVTGSQLQSALTALSVPQDSDIVAIARRDGGHSSQRTLVFNGTLYLTFALTPLAANILSVLALATRAKLPRLAPSRRDIGTIHMRAGNG